MLAPKPTKTLQPGDRAFWIAELAKLPAHHVARVRADLAQHYGPLVANELVREAVESK